MIAGSTAAPASETDAAPREEQPRRVIKKYSNRRLYDTYISAYVTLEDIHMLVLSSVEFQVVDVKTGKDLTRSILLQIIASQEAQRDSVFSVRALSDIICCYSESVQGTTNEFLREGMELLSQQQRDLQRRMQEIAVNPVRTMSEMMERNLAIWGNMQQNFLRSMGFPESRDTPSAAAQSRESPEPKDK